MSIFSTSKKLMHENAIKRVGRVIFLGNLAENLCFSRVLRLFSSCFLCFFGSTSVFFRKKFLATLCKFAKDLIKSHITKLAKKIVRYRMNCRGWHSYTIPNFFNTFCTISFNLCNSSYKKSTLTQKYNQSVGFYK